MRIHALPITAALGLLIGAAQAAPPKRPEAKGATAPVPVQTTDAGIAYVTGGVGDTEQRYIERHYGGYSFKLVNAGNGAYVSNVRVTLENDRGETILQTITEGPWLLADLPAGEYVVTARFNKQTRSEKFVVADAAATRRLVLRWTLGD